MHLSWHIEDTGEFMYVRVTGLYDGVPLAGPVIADVADRCKATHRWRVLMDLTAMDGDISSFDRFMLGQHVAKSWGRRIKVAVLTRPERITTFFENVAVNNGGNVRVFGVSDEALSWLRSGKLS